MAGLAVDRDSDFRHIIGLHLVHDRMVIDRMATTVLQRKSRYAAEVGLRQLHFAVENRHHVTFCQSLRLRIRAVTLQAQLVRLRHPEQVLIVATVRLVTRCTALEERRLVQILLFVLFSLIGMAGQTDVDGVRLRETRRLAGVRVVTIDTIARRTRMLDLRFFDLLAFIRMARQAQLLRGRRGQHDLAVLCGLVASAARVLTPVKRGMHEGLHQLGPAGLVRIVTAEAVGTVERLVLVGLRQIGVFGVVAINAERGRILGQMEIGLAIALVARLVRDVAGGATHVQRHVTAAALLNIEALRVAGQAQVIFLRCT